MADEYPKDKLIDAIKQVGELYGERVRGHAFYDRMGVRELKLRLLLALRSHENMEEIGQLVDRSEPWADIEDRLRDKGITLATATVVPAGEMLFDAAPRLRL